MAKEHRLRVLVPDADVLGELGARQLCDLLRRLERRFSFVSTPGPLAPNVACVDYSVAKNGRLCAYRYDGEPVLDAAKFVSVGVGGT